VIDWPAGGVTSRVITQGTLNMMTRNYQWVVTPRCPPGLPAAKPACPSRWSRAGLGPARARAPAGRDLDSDYGVTWHDP
jgi:hypothetical protein